MPLSLARAHKHAAGGGEAARRNIEAANVVKYSSHRWRRGFALAA